VLSSGNVLFSTTETSEAAVAEATERIMKRELGRVFPVMVRSVEALRGILDADVFAPFDLATGSKRVVTFLPRPPGSDVLRALPITLEDARIHAVQGREAFTSYVPSGAGPVFMKLIESTFGK